MSKLLTTLLLMISASQLSFKQAQLQHARVKEAYTEKEHIVEKYFTEKKINQEGFQLFIRAFKKEKRLEVWVKEKSTTRFVLLQHYDFCSSSGTLGPKRKEGDLQIPEGVYTINHFNPVSNFHLSLGINYPNDADRMLCDKKYPGGEIYIHGNCVTVGCIPITDDKIKELYILAVEARNNGQKTIPVQIFPAVLDEQGMRDLKTEFSFAPQKIKLWEQLQRIFKDFERSFTLKPIRVNAKGEYTF